MSLNNNMQPLRVLWPGLLLLLLLVWFSWLVSFSSETGESLTGKHPELLFELTLENTTMRPAFLPALPLTGGRPHRLPADALDAPPLRGHGRHAQGLILKRRRPPPPLRAASPTGSQRSSSCASRPPKRPGRHAHRHGDGPALSRLRPGA